MRLKFLFNTLASTGFALVALSGAADAEPAFGYNLQLDVVYGEGKIAPEGTEVSRELLLDVYTPSAPADGEARPAVILVHGGAYYRGGRRQPPYTIEGAVHSRQEDYARLLAPLGYVAFVIEYRLAPEVPVQQTPMDHPDLQDMDVMAPDSGIDRSQYVRDAMGLPKISDAEVRELGVASILAAAEDIKKSVDYVRANAALYNVDPDRIALGGHSAGAAAVMNAAFGLKADVKAIFPLSPGGGGFDLAKVLEGPDLPATLIMQSQNDLAISAETIPLILSEMNEAGHAYQFAWVPGFGHFYPTGAVSLGDDATRTSVGERVTDFLADNL
ncbi:MAG: alpha/beta hydrolase [Geminicoccaceae bacterium]